VTQAKAHRDENGTTPQAAEARAQYFVPEKAFSRPISKVPAAVFSAERAQAFAAGCPTGFITLDQSHALGCDWPSTTPAMLARYVVLRPGEAFAHRLHASGLVYYVLRGAGTATAAGETLDWAAGDGFCLPGNADIELRAPEGGILMLFTDEPLVRYLHVTGGTETAASIRPTLFPRAVVDGHLDAVHGRNEPQMSAGKSVTYVTELMADWRLTTPSLIAAINTLEPGGDQRPHKHSSCALTLPIEEEGVFSKLDGEDIPWEPDTLFVTPPYAVHSHHNRGLRMMRAFVVQDTALHSGLRSISFQWTDEAPA